MSAVNSRLSDHHLVERQETDLFGDVGGYAQHRVALLALPRFAKPLVHLQHEGMEMGPALRLHIGCVECQVHQHRFAAPDTAPQVNARKCRRFAAKETA